MVSPENSNWLFDYPLIDDVIPVGDASFSVSASAFSWPPPPANVRYLLIHSSNLGFLFQIFNLSSQLVPV